MTKPWTVEHVRETLEIMLNCALEALLFLLAFFSWPIGVLYLCVVSLVKWEWDWDAEGRWLATLAVADVLFITFVVSSFFDIGPHWSFAVLAGIATVFISALVFTGARLEAKRTASNLQD